MYMKFIAPPTRRPGRQRTNRHKMLTPPFPVPRCVLRPAFGNHAPSLSKMKRTLTPSYNPLVNDNAWSAFSWEVNTEVRPPNLPAANSDCGDRPRQDRQDPRRKERGSCTGAFPYTSHCSLPLPSARHCPPAAPGGASEVRPGLPAPAFAAWDVDGRPVDVQNFAGKIIVLEWTNDQCPFCGKH
jgi:hypothetical protein